ncbi:MAG: ABC transporter permease [Cyclobacteriaceae bacterium]|nr:ABC transporter permease [Cyclobacteriaceae bacterium]
MIPLLIKSSFRLLSRNRVLSSVKIIGLAVGSAVFLLTTHFCLEELQYDQQHPGAENVYRYVHRVITPEGLQSFAVTSAMTGPALKERFPEVAAYCRVFATRVSLRNPVKDVSFNERRFAFADSTFLDLFRFPLQSGNPAALNNPLSIILTPAMAKKYFGDDEPVGKVLILNGEMEFTVAGVFKENFRRTHFNFDFVTSYESLEVIRNNPSIAGQIPISLNLEKKGYNVFCTYLRLVPGSAAGLEAKFPSFIEDFRGKGVSERLKPSLQPMTSIHLESKLLYELDQNGSIMTVVVYFSIGLIVLLIACINYINLSTADLMNRAKGIGLKKILGIKRSSLILNHLVETSVVAVISLLVCVIIAGTGGGAFNNLINRQITYLDTTGLLLLTVILVVIILFSGLYPAIFIARAKGLEAFRGDVRPSRSGNWLHNGLIFFQLLTSFSLVSVSMLMYGQLDFLIRKDPGFDADQVMTINATAATFEQRMALKSELLREPAVSHTGQCSVPPGEPLFSLGVTLPQHEGEDERRIMAYQSFVDEDFMNALGIQLESGRFFDPLIPADSTGSIVINSAALGALGNDVLTTNINIPNLLGSSTQTSKKAVGVVNDFHFASFHKVVEPLLLEYNPRRCNYLLVRLQGGSAREVVEAAGRAWKNTVPGLPFEYYFMDERFARFYDNEMRQKNLIGGMSVIAIVLAALGIFGTTLFVVQRRTREVGIRKMLGSSRTSLLVLLVRPVIALVTAACAAGIPVAFLSGSKWLEQYPSRIVISPFMFLAAFVLVVAVVSTTILYHFIRMTSISPVEVLRQRG